jgi:hypothetical protein
MQLNTFPMTVEAIHSTGLNIVRCKALGTRDVFLTDDMGDFVPVSNIGGTCVSLHEAAGSH